MLPRMFDIFRKGKQFSVQDPQLDTSKLTRTLENVLLYTYNQNVNTLSSLCTGMSNTQRYFSTLPSTSKQFLEAEFKLMRDWWEKSSVGEIIANLLALMIVLALALGAVMSVYIVGFLICETFFILIFRPGSPVAIIPFDDELSGEIIRLVSSTDNSLMILSFPIRAQAVPRWEVSNRWKLSNIRAYANVYYEKNTMFTSTPTSTSKFTVYNTTQHSATVAARVAVIIDGDEASKCLSSTSERLVDVRIKFVMNWDKPVPYFGALQTFDSVEKTYGVCCSEQKYCSV